MKKRMRYETCTRASLGGSAGILAVNRTWGPAGIGPGDAKANWCSYKGFRGG